MNLVVTSYSHLPFYRQAGATLFISPGSVGSPFDRDPRASYVVVEVDPEWTTDDPLSSSVINHHFFRMKYDIQSTVDIIREITLSEAYAQCLLKGQNLDTVLPQPEKWEVPGPDEESWLIGPFPSLENRQAQDEQQLEKVIQLAIENKCNLDHVHRATFLALSLFDSL